MLYAAAVRAGDDLEEMAIGVFEVNPAAAVVAVDFPGAVLAGVGRVLQPSLADAAEDLIEVDFTQQEGVVLARDLAVGRVEVEGGAVAELDDQERPEANGRRQANCWKVPFAKGAYRPRADARQTMIEFPVFGEGWGGKMAPEGDTIVLPRLTE